VLDEKLIPPLSLVDAVIRDSSLFQRPSQTKVELTSSHDTPSTGSAVVQGGGGKSESTGQQGSLFAIQYLVVFCFCTLSTE